MRWSTAFGSATAICAAACCGRAHLAALLGTTGRVALLSSGTVMSNVRFAGNYRTFPSVASTGTALYSGLECATAILAEDDQRSDLIEAARSFRLRSMPGG